MRFTEAPAVALQRLRRSSETRTVPEDDFETPAIAAAKMKIFEKILLDDLRLNYSAFFCQNSTSFSNFSGT